MTHLTVALIVLAAMSWMVIHGALKNDVDGPRDCDGGCGRSIPLFTGVWDASRHVYCSGDCMIKHAQHPTI